MGKVVKIGVLVTAFSMINSTTVKAENKLVKDSLSSDRELELNEVTVVGSKTESLQGLTTTQQIVSKRDVERLPLLSLEASLRQSAGIDIRERGTKGVQADLSVRGGTFDQNLIFLNGVNFSDSRTGHQSLSLPVDVEIVDRIQLLRGVTAPGALTGAINIITSTSQKNYLNAEINSGQNAYQLFRLTGNYRVGNSSLFSSFSHRQSDGYTTNTDFRTTNAFLHFRHNSQKAGQFDWQAGYQQKAFGANAFYSLLYPNQFEKTRTAITSLGWSKQIGKLSLTSNLNYKRTYDRFELYRDFAGAAAWYKTHNYHRSDDAGASFAATYVSALGKTYWGADYRMEQVHSNVLGVAMKDTLFDSTDKDAFYTKEKTRHIKSSYLKHRFFGERWQAEVALNGVFTPFGNDLLWGANAQYLLTEGLTLRANANKTLRMPSFTDIYYKSSTQLSNPNLGLEKALNFDLGVEFATGNLSTSAIVFLRKTENEIDWVKHQSTDSVIWRAKNYDEQKTGVELRASYKTNTIFNSISLGYNYIHSDKDLGNYLSKYVLDFVKHKVTAEAVLELSKKLSLGVTGIYWDRNGLYVDAKKSTRPYSPYATLDAQLNWREKNYTLKLSGANLTDTRFFDIGGLRQAGTWITGGIVVNL